MTRAVGQAHLLQERAGNHQGEHKAAYDSVS